MVSLADLSPPHSQEAEQAVLGGLMLDNSAWDLIADRLTEEDFFQREHRLIFRGIRTLASSNAPFDVVTVSESMSDLAEAGGLAYLGELAKNIPSVANLEHYAEIVQNRAQLRRLIQLGFACSREAAAPQAQAEAVQQSIEQQLFALAQTHRVNEFSDIQKELLKLVDLIDERFNNGTEVIGVSTGLDDLDQITSGLQPADLIILAARPSMGKTSLALNLVDPALRKYPEQSVQVYSLEMPTQQLLFRLLALLGGLDLQKLMKGQLDDEDWPRLQAAMHKLNSYGDRLVIDDTPAQTPTALRAKARRAARRYGPPALILVDYLQLMKQAGKENRANEIADISGALKALAKEMGCPVVALSQLNRDLERRPNKRPINADLRDGGAIEQDADVILFVYRDEIYHPDTEHKGIAEIIVGKQRNGPTGTVRTAFIAHQTRFVNLSANTDWQGARA